MMQKVGLVLSGGGARAAYQAGVLKGIADLLPGDTFPFSILTGVSGGAINAAFVASRGETFQESAQLLWETWEHLKTEDVFRIDRQTLALLGLQWLIGQNLKGLLKAKVPGYLVNGAPLRTFLESLLNFETIYDRIHSGKIQGVAFTATNLDSGLGVTFFDGQSNIRNWFRSNRMGIRTDLDFDHVLASAAIPLFFPPVGIKGSYYGDGCIRLTTPFSPAVHLGSDRILAIGIHHPPSPRTSIELLKRHRSRFKKALPSLADVLGILLDAVFLDSLETDFERMQRINRTLRLIPEEGRQHYLHKLRPIPVMAIRPSKDLGEIASRIAIPFPYPFRHFLRAMGSSPERTSDLLSYLAFNECYTKRLLKLGYKDAIARKQELKAFLRRSDTAKPNTLAA